MKIFIVVLACMVCHTMAAACIEKCADEEDGDYSWCGVCEQYLSCVSGKAVLRDCPAGLAFDRDEGEFGACVKYYRADGCASSASTWHPCRARLCDHGSCEWDPDTDSTFTCECEPGWKNPLCDCEIEPCPDKATEYILHAGQHAFDIFPDHTGCVNKADVTKAFCKGACIEDSDNYCKERRFRDRSFVIECDDNFQARAHYSLPTRCRCKSKPTEPCALVNDIRPAGSIVYIVDGVEYMNVADVALHKCRGACEDGSECIVLNNSHQNVTVGLLSSGGDILNWWYPDPTHCSCLQTA